MLAKRIPNHKETPELMVVSMIDLDDLSYGDSVATAENNDAGRWHLKKEMLKVAKLTNDTTFSFSVLNMN